MKKNRAWLLVTAIALGLASLYLSPLMIYVAVAAIVALIGKPMDRFYAAKLQFGKYGASPTLSALLALGTLLLVFILVIGIFTPLVLEEITIISSLDKDTLYLALKEPVQYLESKLRSLHIPLDKVNILSYLQEKVSSFFTLTNISLLIKQLLNATGNLMVSFFSISFLSFFFMRDGEQIIRSIFSFIPATYHDEAKNVWVESEALLKRYFIGVLVEIVIVTILLLIGLWIGNIKHALLIAVFAGLMNVIPYVGPLIGCGFALLIGITTNTDVSMLSIITKILIVFPLVNLADAFLLQPYIFSNSIKAHPLEIFLVILAGGTLGGIGGMMLAVPAYTVLRLMAKEIYIHFGEKD
jgi:predicted PurR-regulated permease PerM